MRNVALTGLSMFIITACVKERPVLYPNDLVRRVGWAAAEREIDDCMDRAEEYARRASLGEVILEENITGSRGLSGGLPLESTLKQDPTLLYRSFVNTCLRNKGYEPLAWK